MVNLLIKIYPFYRFLDLDYGKKYRVYRVLWKKVFVPPVGIGKRIAFEPVSSFLGKKKMKQIWKSKIPLLHFFIHRIKCNKGTFIDVDRRICNRRKNH